MRWDEMSMSQKSEAIGLMVRNGVTDIGTMKQMWDDMDGRKKPQQPPFAKRFEENPPRTIPTSQGNATHFMAADEAKGRYFAYPTVQPIDYKNDRSPLKYYGDRALDRALENNDVMEFKTLEDAIRYSENYKRPPSTGAYLNNEFHPLYSPYDYVRSFAKGGFTSPDHDPNNPYHYHVNGQKVVVTPEDWERYKDDPTFREVRAAVEAEQAAHPEPEYDEVPNPVWKTAYQRLLRRVNLRGRDNVSQPLPQGYTRDTKGVAMDANGNYYIPVTDATDAPYFVNQERGMYGHNVPVRYEQQQMPTRTIRQLKQPLPVDRVMNIAGLREDSIDRYIKDNTKQTVQTLYKAPTYYPSENTFERLDNDEMDAYIEWLRNESKKFPQVITKEELKDWFITAEEMGEDLTDDINVYSPDEDFERAINKYISVPQNRVQQKKTYIPSRQEAEKKAVISIGDLEKVGTFANGGSIDDPPDKKPAIPVGGYLPDYYPSQQEWLRNWFGNREEQINDNFKGIALGVSGFDPSRSIPVQYVERAIDGSMKVPVKYQSIFNDPDNPTSAYNRDTRQIFIDPNMQDIESTLLHERTHALNHQLPQRVVGQQGYEMSPIESKVRDVMMPWYKENEQDLDEYWDDPVEIYARMMQMRYRLNLDPTKKVTKDDLNKWRKDGLLRQYEMGVYDDDTLLQLFNEVADNRQMQNNQQNTYVIPTDIGLGYV